MEELIAQVPVPDVGQLIWMCLGMALCIALSVACTWGIKRYFGAPVLLLLAGIFLAYTCFYVASPLLYILLYQALTLARENGMAELVVQTKGILLIIYRVLDGAVTVLVLYLMYRYVILRRKKPAAGEALMIGLGVSFYRLFLFFLVFLSDYMTAVAARGGQLGEILADMEEAEAAEWISSVVVRMSQNPGDYLRSVLEMALSILLFTCIFLVIYGVLIQKDDFMILGFAALAYVGYGIGSAAESLTGYSNDWLYLLAEGILVAPFIYWCFRHYKEDLLAALEKQKENQKRMTAQKKKGTSFPKSR